MSLPGQLTPTPRLLLGPGPSDAHPRVLTAMTTPLLGHLSQLQFLQIMTETQELMRLAYRTANRLTFPVSATGMAGMETCVVNLVEPGDRIVVCSKGYFGTRMVDVAGRTGAELTVLEAPWGQVFDLDRIRDTLKRVRPKVLGIVHAETSTGAWQPIQQLGKLCHEFDTLLVDAVTSLGCVPVEVDGWEFDAVFSCSQKGLGCPPGLSPISFSDRAVAALKSRKTKVQSWYLDLSMIESYWGGDRAYHHTAPISMIYALREGLRIVLEEGLEARWERHQRNHKAIAAGLAAIRLPYIAAEGNRLPQLNAVRLPAGVDDLAGRKMLLNDFGIEVGGGLGEFKGQAWRIGLMGYNSRPACVLLVLSALEQVLRKQGVNVEPGAGVAAAERVYGGG